MITMPRPIPPGYEARLANHHWLEKKDSDGHSFGLVVLQWCPGAQEWSHSGDVGTGIYVDTSHWEYTGRCFMPGEEFPENSVGDLIQNLSAFDPRKMLVVQDGTMVLIARKAIGVRETDYLSEGASEPCVEIQVELDNTPKCASCGTFKNLHRDYGSGGTWRCDSEDCVVF